MHRCLQCNHEWVAEGVGVTCPSCLHETIKIHGFLAYAPELAKENDGFPKDAFENLKKHEDTSFWFCSRNALITYFLKKYCPNMQNFLETDCGTGFVSQGIQKAFPHLTMIGSEIYTNGLICSFERLKGKVSLIQCDARELPFTEEFDVIGAFDVLEHIKEDEKVLAEIHRALKPNGYTFLSVPQHMWMGVRWMHNLAMCVVMREMNYKKK